WFFFSSRRRHTRLVSDWSSDVCSSDLAAGYYLWSTLARATRYCRRVRVCSTGNNRPHSFHPGGSPHPSTHRARHRCARSDSPGRSEERRVGKEGRDRGAWERAKNDERE